MPTITIDSDEPIVVLKLSEYESLMETLDILEDNPNIIHEINESKQAIANGKGISLHDYRLMRKS